MKRWLRIRQLAWGFGRRTKSEAGYTITEVMIVLGVTSLMFVAIVLAFSGRQARIEFSQSVRDYESALQNIMNEVASGNYQSNFRCQLDGGGRPAVDDGGPAIQTGTSEACIFLGKVIIPAVEEPNTMSVTETLVGRRLATSGGDVTNLPDARPVVIASARDAFNHSFGLEIRQIQVLGTTNRLFGLGFINQLSRGSLTTGADQSGGEGLIRLYGLLDPDLAAADGIVDSSRLVPIEEGAVICVRGHNGQFAEIVIGEGSSQNSITSVLDTRESGERCSEL